MKITLKVLKFLNTFLFLFSTNILAIRAGIHKILARIANREDPERLLLHKQKQSDLGLHCLSTVNVLKFLTLFSFSSQINFGYQGWNSQNACQNSKQGRP